MTKDNITKIKLPDGRTVYMDHDAFLKEQEWMRQQEEKVGKKAVAFLNRLHRSNRK